MYKRIIKNNINNLNKYLTKGFLENKNIEISLEEAEVVTEILKANWEKLYQGNYQDVFNLLNGKVKKETKESLLSLYLTTMKQYF